MCGIFGYKWVVHEVASVLLHGLQRLEYRGYDSAGMYVVPNKYPAHTYKAVGKVCALVEKVAIERGLLWVAQFPVGWSGIAHTRWATHGWITENNCHPHASNDGKFHIVHNGIIENYLQLKKELLHKEYVFSSETDTEVIANLLQEAYAGDFLGAVQQMLTQIRGAYALLIVHDDHPGEMIWLRWGSPLFFGYDMQGEFYFSSDSQALSGYAQKVIYLEDGDLLHLTWNDYVITSGGIPQMRTVEELNMSAMEASKGEFKHFMLKEIFEQPNIIKRIFKWRVDFDHATLAADAFHGMQRESYKQVVFVGCGTSYNAWLLGSMRARELWWIDTKTVIASEYANSRLLLRDEVLHVFISQSWETADSIECLKNIAELWGKTFGVVNVVGSSIARMTDSGLFTRAGTEIGVASTKAFTAQSVCLFLLALFMGKNRSMPPLVYKRLLRALEHLPMQIEAILDQSEYIRSVASSLVDYPSLFFLWRHYQLAAAIEASLKFKEITYHHAESYPLGELKHWPLAMIDEHCPSIILMPEDDLFEKNCSSVQEIKSRKGMVVAISDVKVPGADLHITIPKTVPELSPLLTVVVGQLLAYHTAELLNRDIDKPRNLAKSVTVK
jgi:glucosamine--fructose-6-phosphate aminotransferase (isomerizing)